ncbi:hypothetical protein BUE80_DR013422 [Diplocarpon rosae]|nr:hypothetical protein BUE80_DR013422 [Diplocarpon rosae]
MAHSIRRHKTDISERSTASDESQDTQSTAPTTLYSNFSIPRADLDYSEKQHFDLSPCTNFCARSSTETYSSTVESFEELTDEPDTDNPSDDALESRAPSGGCASLRPSTPADFAHFFPSLSRLCIRHDDTTPDGNMNLRVDIERRRGTIQLFHLKMNDLRQREFSLRRYERASGRERQDSGYGSGDEHEPSYFSPHAVQPPLPPSDTVKLEFANYAQVEVKPRGAKAATRYEFEYWGSRYAWRRVERRSEVEYHLFREGKAEQVPVAHIVPELRSPEQVREEERKGGWVPPCSMWIEERGVLKAESDVADSTTTAVTSAAVDEAMLTHLSVIVATGLIALVDDTIKRRFHPQSRPSPSPHLSAKAHPHSSFKLDFGPKALVEHMFKRRDSVPEAASPSRFASGGGAR